MSRQWTMHGLLAAMLLQLGILAAEYLGAVYPLWTGHEVQLKTIPVDPRSMFRGNYAHLDYEISSINMPLETDISDPRWGEVVYVKLKPGENNLYIFDSASFSEPQSGLYIRGRIQQPWWERATQPYQVRYGIEAYFAPKDKALELEKQLRDGGIAVVMLADNGKAALKEVIAEVKE